MPSDAQETPCGYKSYGKRKYTNFPPSIAAELKRAAEEQGVSESLIIVEAVAEKLGIDFDN